MVPQHCTSGPCLRHPLKQKGLQEAACILFHSKACVNFVCSVAAAAKRVQLAALMPQLRQRHRYALQSGKGGQGAAARTADVAATSLEAKVQPSPLLPL